MGNNPSITEQQKQELWNRDINRLFTTAKIVPAQSFPACYIQSIKTIGDKNESNLICLFCNDGIIRGVLQSTKSTAISSTLIFTIVAESQNVFLSNQNDSFKSIHFTSATKLSEKYIVITISDGRYFLISAREKQTSDQNSKENRNIYFDFVLTSFTHPTTEPSGDNDISPCIIKYTNDSFIAIDHQMTAVLCKSDGSIQIIWDGNQLKTNQILNKSSKKSTDAQSSPKQYFSSCSLYCCASVYANYLFAVHFSHDGNWKGLTYGIVKEKINPLQNFDESLTTIVAMDTYESGIYCLCDSDNQINNNNDRFSVISIDIDKNQIVSSHILNFKELNQNDNYVVDFKVIDDKKTLLCLTQNSIITYTAEIDNHISQYQLNITGNIKFSQLASLSSQIVFNVVVSTDQEHPNLCILRVSRKSKKTQIELLPLPVKLSEGQIVGSCPVDDFTFATLEQSGKVVIWQSQPEWWDVPYFQKIFDDQKQQQ